MVIVMEKGAPQEKVQNVLQVLNKRELGYHLSEGMERTIIGVLGKKENIIGNSLEALEGVEKVVSILTPFKLASRDVKKDNSVVKIGGITLGGKDLQVMAGPCAVESRDQIHEIAEIVKKGGARIMRGGAFKPRTSPYSFQGLEEQGLKYLREAGDAHDLLIVTEVVDTRDVDLVANYADIMQIGARNMQNFALLKQVAKCGKPVVLKRGIAATVEEWIMAAEYLLAGGNEQVILCERGIRTYENYTRNTLDLSVVPIIKQLTHLPIIVDPSHGTGKWRLVEPMSKAAIAAGADGLMVEVHPRPSEALSDGPQSLKSEKYFELMDSLEKIAKIMDRRLKPVKEFEKTGTEG